MDREPFTTPLRTKDLLKDRGSSTGLFMERRTFQGSLVRGPFKGPPWTFQGSLRHRYPSEGPLLTPPFIFSLWLEVLL